MDPPAARELVGVCDLLLGRVYLMMMPFWGPRRICSAVIWIGVGPCSDLRGAGRSGSLVDARAMFAEMPE